MRRQMHAKLRWCAQALNFGEFSGPDKAKEATKNYWFNIFVYEDHDPWHTRYSFTDLDQDS